MPLSAVQAVRATFAWSAFLLGLPLNGLAVWAIHKHTPSGMRVYSKILLQTCVTDFLLLILVVFADEVASYNSQHFQLYFDKAKMVGVQVVLIADGGVAL
jgi:hypothetical protein